MVERSEHLDLVRFLREVEDVLSWTIANLDELLPVVAVDSALKEALKLAWQEYESSSALREAEQAIVGRDFDAPLDGHGLSGRQLAFKLQLFHSHLAQFEHLRSSGPPFDSKSRWSRFLERLLGRASGRSSQEASVRW